MVGAPRLAGFGSAIVPKMDVGVELVIDAPPSEVDGVPKLGVLVSADEDPDVPKIEVAGGIFCVILGEASDGFAGVNAELLLANIDGGGASLSAGVVASLFRDAKILGAGFCASEGVLFGPRTVLSPNVTFLSALGFAVSSGVDGWAPFVIVGVVVEGPNKWAKGLAAAGVSCVVEVDNGVEALELGCENIDCPGATPRLDCGA